MTYTDAELGTMLADLESDLVERKESLKGEAPTAVREAICAFANDLPDRRRAGIVFIGARNDGSPAGLVVTDELLRQLADMKTDGNILPPPSLTVEKRRLLDADLAVVAVAPADSPPVKYKGRVYIRIGPRRGIASAQDERILSEKRRHRDKPFDVQPLPSAALQDLDRRRFEEEYLPAAFDPEVLAANERRYEERLAATKMIQTGEDLVPTVLGILVLSSRTRDFLPGAYIQFLRISGRELSDPIADEQAIDGPLSEVLRRIDEKLAAHNRIAVDITSGPRERRSPAYPMPALQQIVRNAVMHRSYEATNAPVRVTWYDDRIEIANPGGPYGVVTEANFGQPGFADYRNPNVAEALRVLGFVQRFGVGIATARRELEANGNPPLEFVVTPTHIGAILRAAQ
jgi:ATP-dependent DNA helicase RecG